MYNTKVVRVVELMERIDAQILYSGKVDNESVIILCDLMDKLSQEETLSVDELYFNKTK